MVSSVCVDGAVVLATVKDEPLRGGLRPSLTATARAGTASTGRDDGMAALIEQQDVAVVTRPAFRMGADGASEALRRWWLAHDLAVRRRARCSVRSWASLRR